MAAIEQTSVEGGEDQNYVEVLRVLLQQKKLIYIADIVLEEEQVTLEQLIKWTRRDLTDLLVDINDDNNNNHKIKAIHRNKFAETVCNIAAKQKQALEKELTASTSSQIKLLFLGKEEEEAIEEIQSGQQFMGKKLDKMKELFNKLDENDKSIKQKLDKICHEIKQQIDKKQKQMIANINMIYQYHLNILNKRNEATQESAKVVAKFFNDYEGYFSDNKLSKSDRKNKLIAAKDSIAAEVDKMKKYNKDISYNMDMTVNKDVVDRFLDEFLDIGNFGIDLAAVTNVDLDGTVIKWKLPDLKEEVKEFVFKKDDDDDNKEENNVLINYRILYEKKDDDDEWHKLQIIDVGKENQYEMKDYIPSQVAIQYTINNILRSPISIIINNEDKWDTDNVGDGVIIKGNTVTFGNKYRSAYLTKVVSEGVHIWTFKVIACRNYLDMIGIWKTNAGIPEKGNRPNNGYFYRLQQGEISKPDKPSTFGSKYGVKCKGNDIVEMMVDFYSLSLSFKVNNVDYGKAFDISKEPYKAAVSFYYRNTGVMLMEYLKK